MNLVKRATLTFGSLLSHTVAPISKPPRSRAVSQYKQTLSPFLCRPAPCFASIPRISCSNRFSPHYSASLLLLGLETRPLTAALKFNIPANPSIHLIKQVLSSVSLRPEIHQFRPPLSTLSQGPGLGLAAALTKISHNPAVHKIKQPTSARWHSSCIRPGLAVNATTLSMTSHNHVIGELNRTLSVMFHRSTLFGPNSRPSSGPAAVRFTRLYRTETPEAPYGACTRSDNGAGIGTPVSTAWRRPDSCCPACTRVGSQSWYKHPRALFLLVITGGTIATALYYGKIETVPYSERYRFIVNSQEVELQLGRWVFEQVKEMYRDKFLHPNHPHTLRVHRISKRIIDSLQQGFFCDNPERKEAHISREIIDTLRQAEVYVVQDNEVNAFCLPGGKIVVFSGLLDYFKSDAEIATVIGHEVGHAVARHTVETFTNIIWFTLMELWFLQWIYLPEINILTSLFLERPFSRSMEREADRIGLFLLASAGYDPRVAPQMYQKLAQMEADDDESGNTIWKLIDYLQTHPSNKERAQLLSQPDVMDEALEIYRKVRSDCGKKVIVPTKLLIVPEVKAASLVSSLEFENH